MSQYSTGQRIRDPSGTQSERLFPNVELTPASMAALYAVLGVTALVGSDVVLPLVFQDPVLAQLQAIKGFLEVVLTAGFIFAVTRRSHTRLQNRTQQVEQARDELTLLHRVMRHNLRNDLNVVHGYANLTKIAIEKGQATRYCEQISETTAQMIRYSEHARHIRKVTETSGRRHAIDLGELLARVQSANSALGDTVAVTTDIPDSFEVQANPMLEAAVDELLTNAVIHNTASDPRVLIEGADIGEGMVELRIVDNGPGIPAEELETLRGEPGTEVQHPTGLGLWFVDWTATHSGGEFRIERPESGGTRAVLRLPKSEAAA